MSWMRQDQVDTIYAFFFNTIFIIFLRKMLTNFFGTIIKDTKYNEIILKLI
jgi:hypothetical protein